MLVAGMLLPLERAWVPPLVASLALGLAPQGGETSSESSSKSSAEAGATRVVFLATPVVDLYFSARVASSAASVPELLAPAVGPVRELERALGGSGLAWGPVDGLLGACSTAADVKAAFASAPELFELRGGAKVELRKHALAIADALAVVEPAFGPSWKEHEPRLAQVRARWEQSVGPKERALFDYHLASLGVADPRAELRVYVVSQAPWPGAFTVYDDDGRGLSFVAHDAAEGSQLLEIVLHEVTHTLDLASDEASVLGELRARLEQAGLGPRDRALHDLPHALMFVQSAESLRRVVEPAHVDYGETEEVYARMGTAAQELRALWIDHLEGKLTRAEAIEEIVASATGAPR